MVDAPLLVHPLACRCLACNNPRYPGYVHYARVEDMARHLAQIVAMERMQGIRPLERMPERE